MYCMVRNGKELHCQKLLADFTVPVCDGWRYCKAVCDEKFSLIQGNGRKFSHIVECKNVTSYIC